jgi:cation:H+ antiporter
MPPLAAPAPALAALAVLIGMGVLVLGAEALVRGASRLAAAAGVSALVIGLTVVAYGTSAPELAVSVGDALTGEGAVAVGNAVGSNIFNVLAILGIAAVAGGLVVHQRLVRIDVPLLLVVTAGVWWLAADGAISTVEGALLVVGILVYSAASYVLGRREPAAVEAEYDEAFGTDPAEARRGWPRAVGLVLLGLAALVGGSQALVWGATSIASALGVSELVIGLTVVAAGTSLPELATSVVAVRRGERDIAVGNIVGSNLFNLLAVLGLSAVVGGGLPVPAAAIATDLPVALLVTLVALPALALGLSVARWEGVLLLGAYLGYVGYLVLSATGSAVADGGRWVLLGGLAVLAVAITAIGVALERRQPAEVPG